MAALTSDDDSQLGFGIGAGFVVWTLVKMFRGKFNEIHPVMYVISVAFLIYFLRSYLGVDA